MTLEDIGEGDDALLCKTNLTDCCQPSYINPSGLGNWFIPNGTRIRHGNMDFYRTRGQMAVLLHHRGGGVDGIYRCEIPDSMNVTQNIYIGVYNTCTGERQCLYTLVLFKFTAVLMLPQGLHVSNVTRVEVSMQIFILVYCVCY